MSKRTSKPPYSRFEAHQNFRHDSPQRTGVLITNLGTPQAPTAAALRHYLREFLSDSRVVELPRWLWLTLLHGIILRFRPRRSARAYAKVWTARGSPLMVNSLDQLQALRTLVDSNDRPDAGQARLPIALGMNYGSPAIETALDELRSANVTRLLVIPLFPQYSGSTTGSTFDALCRALGKWRWVPEIRFINSYHDHPLYIDALADSVLSHRVEHGSGEHLLISFHGLPQRYLLAGDPYYCQCQATARLVAQRLQLDPASWSIVFQSRFGREQWLQPYTNDELKVLADRGLRRVDIICPGFSADCVETLEEIVIEGSETFRSAGGECLSYIPALNAQPAHIRLIAELIQTQLRDWQPFIQTELEDRKRREQRWTRAAALGAEH